MYFIGQQIVKRMQDIGWDAILHECFRDSEEQLKYYDLGLTVDRPYESPHQFSMAVYIVHRTDLWRVPDRFWEDLSACAAIVGDQFGLELEHCYNVAGYKAHIALKSWRDIRARFGNRPLTSDQLDLVFEELLPSVWKQHTKSVSYQTRQ